jgi:hypothetical protein
MDKSKDRIVYRLPDGTWANKREDAQRASSIHITRENAKSAAREMLKNEGGGKLIIHGIDGRIESEDLISPK